MVTRCTNPNHTSYADYGARGLRVCPRWLKFGDFLADMGARPSAQHSIDRIDPTGDYRPGNCRWATRQEQGRNKRRQTFVVVDGVPLRLFEAATRLGISTNAIQHRVKRGLLKKFVSDCDNALRDGAPGAASFCADDQVVP